MKPVFKTFSLACLIFSFIFDIHPSGWEGGVGGLDTVDRLLAQCSAIVWKLTCLVKIREEQSPLITSELLYFSKSAGVTFFSPLRSSMLQDASAD